MDNVKEDNRSKKYQKLRPSKGHRVTSVKRNITGFSSSSNKTRNKIKRTTHHIKRQARKKDITFGDTCPAKIKVGHRHGFRKKKYKLFGYTNTKTAYEIVEKNVYNAPPIGISRRNMIKSRYASLMDNKLQLLREINLPEVLVLFCLPYIANLSFLPEDYSCF